MEMTTMLKRLSLGLVLGLPAMGTAMAQSAECPDGVVTLRGLTNQGNFPYPALIEEWEANNPCVDVVFTEAVTGLSVGGSVNFNGIKVGDVGELGFDAKDPRVVIATIRVSPSTPLRRDVKATLGFQTLSGIAYVDLSGGSTSAPLLLDPDADEPPVIYAERSAFGTLQQDRRDKRHREHQMNDENDGRHDTSGSPEGLWKRKWPGLPPFGNPASRGAL